MPPRAPRTELDTHTVSNQPPARAGLALWEGDFALQRSLDGVGADAKAAVAAFAGTLGASETVEMGQTLATTSEPELVAFDAGGRRIDSVRYHPHYHSLMETGLGAGYAAMPWRGTPGGHSAHAAMVYLMSQVEPGVCCPMTMTYAAIPALSGAQGWAAGLREAAVAGRYDARDGPLDEKRGATIGMAMTEKQGGSDVRANTTRAEPDGDAVRLYGHKWFCSAPMSDAFLTLAQEAQGLSCFAVPRWGPDGERNAIHLMRLKSKLGNRSNASAEIEYHGAWAARLGAPGHGVATILEMVHHTRLDTAMAPAGLMRRALVEARDWAETRSAFGKRLIDQPLMRAVLADMALEWHGSLAMAMRVARAFDAGTEDPEARAFARLSVALAKYWNNKRAPLVIAEAMECLGGMGYVEDTPMPWLYREAPLNAIWEGSGNVICLDALRTLEKVPEARDALAKELDAAKGLDPTYDAALDGVMRDIDRAEPATARHLVERLAMVLQAAVLMRDGNPVADLFVATRLGGDRGHTLGALPWTADPGLALEQI